MSKKDKESKSLLCLNTHTTKLMALSSSHSQSALEYMMSYGWAILIIVIVAAVLYSFGVFNPSSSTSTTITGFSDFQVAPICTANGYFVLTIGNGLGISINLSAVNITTNTGSRITVNTNTIIAPDNTYTAIVPSACPSVGSRYSLNGVLTYYPAQRAFGPQFSSGTFSGVVSGSTLINITEIGLPIGTTWSIGSSSSSSNSILMLLPSATAINNVSSGGITYYPSIYTLSAGSSSMYVTFLPDERHEPIFIAPNTVNKIFVVNASTGAAITNISIGFPALHVALLPGSTVGYAVGSSRIAVFGTRNYSDAKNITGLSSALGATISPDGKVLYVVGQSSNAIYKISTSNNSNYKNITGDGLNGPFSALLTPDGKYLFVNNNNAGDGNNPNQYIEMFPNGTLIRNITSGSNNCVMNTYGFAISPDGKYIFTANANTNCVAVINTATGSISVISSAGNQGIAALPDDKTVFVAYNTPNTLYKDSYSAVLTSLSTTNYANYPQGVCMSPDNKLLYVSGYNNKTLMIINNTPTPVVWKATVNLGANLQQGMANGPHDCFRG